jgi:hypothetical protein
MEQEVSLVFFMFSIIELILLGAGTSLLIHHKIAPGLVLMGLAVLMFLSTSARYASRGPRGAACCGGLDCLAFECGLLEGLECAECADCGAPGCDCFGA